jgi:hypothetical protein
MGNKRALTTLGATAALLSAPAVPAAAYKVDAEVHSAGSVRAAPTFIVEDGKTARLAATGEDGYTLMSTATNAGPGNVKAMPHSAPTRANSLRP